MPTLAVKSYESVAATILVVRVIMLMALAVEPATRFTGRSSSMGKTHVESLLWRVLRGSLDGLLDLV